MNRQLIAGIAGGFLTGVGVGAALVRTFLEKDLRIAYAEREEIMKRAYEQALELHMMDKPEDPAEETAAAIVLKEVDAQYVSLDERPAPGSGEIVSVKESGEEQEASVSVNPYHNAVSATETTHEQFVQGEVNQYGISYIEDEDYLDDEDGRFKGRVDVAITDEGPIFIMDGAQIDDWQTRLGGSILVDFYTLIPPGVEPVLYVRNHRTDEDYEVVQISQ